MLLPMLSVASLLLVGCASNSGPAPYTTEIPDPPAYLKRVEVAPPKVGEPWPVVAARERAAREEANIRIESGAFDWREMKDTLGGK